jgi:hypothetical protein
MDRISFDPGHEAAGSGTREPAVAPRLSSDFRHSEYDALRATIRERGTAQLWAVLAGLAVWAALALWLRVADLQGGVSFVPLLMLTATYEINLFIHTGVERIGRYVQVFYEQPTRASTGWETTAMSYGARYRGGIDPLFTTIFYGATVIDFSSLLEEAWWTAISAIAHVAVLYRIFSSARLAASQRATDLERFRNLASGQ